MKTNKGVNKMREILQQNDQYVLEMEKLQNKWWLSLVEKSTGLVQAIRCDTKKHARESYKGMSFEEIRTFLDNWGVEKQKVYKAGYNQK